MKKARIDSAARPTVECIMCAMVVALLLVAGTSAASLQPSLVEIAGTSHDTHSHSHLAPTPTQSTRGDADAHKSEGFFSSILRSVGAFLKPLEDGSGKRDANTNHPAQVRFRSATTQQQQAPMQPGRGSMLETGSSVSSSSSGSGRTQLMQQIKERRTASVQDDQDAVSFLEEEGPSGRSNGEMDMLMPFINDLKQPVALIETSATAGSSARSGAAATATARAGQQATANAAAASQLPAFEMLPDMHPYDSVGNHLVKGNNLDGFPFGGDDSTNAGATRTRMLAGSLANLPDASTIVPRKESRFPSVGGSFDMALGDAPPRVTDADISVLTSPNRVILSPTTVAANSAAMAAAAAGLPTAVLTSNEFGSVGKLPDMPSPFATSAAMYPAVMQMGNAVTSVGGAYTQGGVYPVAASSGVPGWDALPSLNDAPLASPYATVTHDGVHYHAPAAMVVATTPVGMPVPVAVGGVVPPMALVQRPLTSAELIAPPINAPPSELASYMARRAEFEANRRLGLSSMEQRKQQIARLQAYVDGGNQWITQKMTQVNAWLELERKRATSVIKDEELKVKQYEQALKGLIEQQRQDAMKVNDYNTQLRKTAMAFQAEQQKKRLELSVQQEKLLNEQVKSTQKEKADIQKQIDSINAELKTIGGSGGGAAASSSGSAAAAGSGSAASSSAAAAGPPADAPPPSL